MLNSLRPLSGATTNQLAVIACAPRLDDLDHETLERAKHSILDFFGLMISSCGQPLVRILRAEAQEDAGRQEASAAGSSTRVSAVWAATINSAAGHCLAYDDVNMVIPGHATAVALPAALALAERKQVDGKAFLDAFIAGCETACRCAELIEPIHYDRGFHASATIGTLGSAATAARVLGLDCQSMTQALSLACSMAAGTKAAFGTMVKPFQVGRAAGNGVLAASLAARGLAGRGDMFEAAQGFAATHFGQLLPAVLPEHGPGYFMKRTLLKYHAACYLAHAPIDCALSLRGRILPGRTVQSVTAAVHPMAAKVCNIDKPRSGQEIGYCIRMLVAMSLLGYPLTKPEDLSPALLGNPTIMTLLEKVQIVFDEALPDTAARVTLETSDGATYEEIRDVGEPVADLDKQFAKVEAKARALAEPVLGHEGYSMLVDLVRNLSDLPSLDPLAALLRVAPHQASEEAPRR